MQNLGQSGPYNCFFFFYSLPASNLRPKIFTKWHDSSFKNTKFSSFWGGGTSPSVSDTRLCAEASIWHCDAPPPPPQQIITKKNNVKKMDLGSWLGGTCNFEVGEGFCRQRLALGNNSDFLEEWTPLMVSL